MKDLQDPPSMSRTVEKAEEVLFCELVRDPTRYDKKVVRTHALLRVDLENEILHAAECDSADSHVWADFDPSYIYSNEQIKDKLAELLRRRPPNPSRTVRVTVVGKFEDFNGKGYGHLEGYRLRFSIMRVEQAEAEPATGVPK